MLFLRQPYDCTHQIQEAIDLVKLSDLVLTPRALARYIEGAFTCVRLFRPEFRASFVLEDDGVDHNPFGDAGSVFPTMLFYACMSRFSDLLTPKRLRAILNKMRSNLYPAGKSSLMSELEEEFVTEVLDVFFVPTHVPLRDVTTQIVSIVRKSSFSETELSRGRAILFKSSKLSPDEVSEDALSFFVQNYFSHGVDLFGGSSSRALGAFFSIVRLFSSYNVALPGQVSRASWMDKISDRVVKVGLIRRISLAGVPETDTSSKMVSEIFSGPISNFSNTYQVPQPYEVPDSPKLAPQKSPGSPPVLDDSGILESSVEPVAEKTVRMPVIQVLPSPTSIGKIRSTSSISNKPQHSLVVSSEPVTSPPPILESPPRSARPAVVDSPTEALELVKQSLLKSGMSPTRSARIASQFVAGGPDNMDALNRVLQQANATAKRRGSQDSRTSKKIN